MLSLGGKSILKIRWSSWPALFCLMVQVPGQKIEILDRMVAVVNGRMVTQSDLQKAAQWSTISADSAGLASVRVNDEVLRLYLERILIRQEIENYPGLEVAEEEIQVQVQRLQAKQPTLEAWKNPSELEKIRAEFREQLYYEKFIDLRFRHFIEVRPEEMDAYYRDIFTGEWNKSGKQLLPPFEQVQDTIRRILIETKIHQQLNLWIMDLKQKAEIILFPENLRFVPETQERQYKVP